MDNKMLPLVLALSNSGGSGGSTEKDWLENDETSSKYIQNRTHYIDKQQFDYNVTLDNIDDYFEYKEVTYNSPELKSRFDVGKLLKIEINGQSFESYIEWNEAEQCYTAIQTYDEFWDHCYDEVLPEDYKGILVYTYSNDNIFIDVHVLRFAEISNIKLSIVDEDYITLDDRFLSDNIARQSDLDEIKLFKFPNATIIGNPTINNGQISDFSKDNYLEFPFLVDFRDRTFEINFQITTSSDVSTQQNILDSKYGLAFAIKNNHFVLALSFNGTSWATQQTGRGYIGPGNTYKVKISWNRLSYKVQYSMDGGATWFDDITFASTQAPYPKQMYIGVGKLVNNYFKGIINFNYANVIINNITAWQGMDDIGLATRLATDLSNIDDAGKDEIKKIVSELISDSLGGSY